MKCLLSQMPHFPSVLQVDLTLMIQKPIFLRMDTTQSDLMVLDLDEHPCSNNSLLQPTIPSWGEELIDPLKRREWNKQSNTVNMEEEFKKDKLKELCKIIDGVMRSLIEMQSRRGLRQNWHQARL